MTETSSPCVLICSIDDKTGYCFGCGRTGEEIGDWMNYSEKLRLSIMSSLEQRMATITRKPRRVTRRKKMANARAVNDGTQL